MTTPAKNQIPTLPTTEEILGDWYECSPYGEQVPLQLPEFMVAFLKQHGGTMDEEAAWELISTAAPGSPWLNLFECIFKEGARFAMCALDARDLLPTQAKP